MSAIARTAQLSAPPAAGLRCCHSSATPSVWKPVRHVNRLRAAAATADDGSAEASIEERFAAELAARQAAEAKAAEAAAAASFDGDALLKLLRAWWCITCRQKYGRSYDVSLVQRKYLGKVFVALNIMWKYMEQQSFGYTEEQYMQRLEYVAAALVSWGAVRSVQSQLTATKERPRVGKAVSIMLNVPEEKAKQWIAL
eukprot:GHRR01012309.1.p1 GENE.GHRR01012309.1~~GHRR01012309.1.p1  ORF type:complete len:198 (+),score=88.10 GHRR01012309.1:155-748(+)